MGEGELGLVEERTAVTSGWFSCFLCGKRAYFGGLLGALCVQKTAGPSLFAHRQCAGRHTPDKLQFLYDLSVHGVCLNLGMIDQLFEHPLMRAART